MCDKGFTQYVTLQHHKSSVHSKTRPFHHCNTKNIWWGCPVLPETFAQSDPSYSETAFSIYIRL